LLAGSSFAQSFTEGFDDLQTDFSGLTARGWSMQNLSDSASAQSWFNGNLTVFAPQGGAGYIGANYQSTTGLTGNEVISNWLISPVVTLVNGSVLSFWSRTVDTPAFPDRMEVRFSTNGASTNAGATSSSVGDFSNLALTINPNETTAGYPNVWTQFNYTVAGVSGAPTGRFAFRYFVDHAGPNGSNSDYIGVDNAHYAPVPEPATLAALGIGALVLIRRRRKA
jgi:hypothetical protein